VCKDIFMVSSLVNPKYYEVYHWPFSKYSSANFFVFQSKWWGEGIHFNLSEHYTLNTQYTNYNTDFNGWVSEWVVTLASALLTWGTYDQRAESLRKERLNKYRYLELIRTPDWIPQLFNINYKPNHYLLREFRKQSQ